MSPQGIFKRTKPKKGSVCEICGGKDNVDWILSLEQFLCEKCLSALHNPQKESK